MKIIKIIKTTLNIVTKILYSQYFFCIITSWYILKTHLYFSKEVLLNQTGFKLLKWYDFSQKPILWKNIKISYVLISLTAIYIITLYIYNSIIKPYEPKYKLFSNTKKSKPNKNEQLSLLVGTNKKEKWLQIEEKGLYQNILITGTIGTGKTTSALYPFTKQLMEYKAKQKDQKAGMLILDVKGNYYKRVMEFALAVGRQEDIKVIEIKGKIKYNPLHKPNLKPIILANRLKTILTLFSEQGTTDTYWLDKAEIVIAEAIKLCRIYNNDYVTFEEIHKLITNKKYLSDKIKKCKDNFITNEITKNKINDLETSLDFFENEYKNLDYRTLSIIQSEITRITQMFVMDLDIKTTFCAPQEFLNFDGFEELIDEGKIVVLKMNLAEYRNLSKVISAYIKLDFQTEVMLRLTRESANTTRPVCFISDEYQEYVTKTDSEFFAQSREAKCINIVATQSYTSLLSTLKNPETTKTIIQNLINKIWFRTDDLFTIEQAQKQLGRVFKERASKSITENAKESKYSYIFNQFRSDKSNLSETINISLNKDYRFDLNEFTQELKTFEAICFISDGTKILEPEVIKLKPIFKQKEEKKQ